MNPMDEVNAIGRRHQEAGDAARKAAQDARDNPPGPPVLKAPIISAWLIGGAVAGFALGYLSFEHPAPAAVCGVLLAVAARIVQGILRGFGAASGAGAVNRGLGGLPQWIIGGALMGALAGGAFMLWLDGINADVVTPAVVCAPIGAAGGFLVRGLMLLLGLGRRRQA